MERNQHGPPLLDYDLLNYFKIQFRIFILITIFLLIEGFFYHYSYKLTYLCPYSFNFSQECNNPLFDGMRSGYNPIIWNENNIIETLQCIFLIFTIIFLFKVIYHIKNLNNKIFYNLLILYFVCILYFFFEEISWGQHIFKWNSNSFFYKYNNQGETNFHNISNLFDQLPRGLLSLWCGLSILILKFAKKLNFKKIYLEFILPNKNLKYISYLTLVFILPDLILDKFGFHPGYSNVHTININIVEIYDFFSFNFIRLSEFQELIFAYYLLNHSYFVKQNMSSKSSVG